LKTAQTETFICDMLSRFQNGSRHFEPFKGLNTAPKKGLKTLGFFFLVV
jgi:hypothetical protein